MRCEQFETGLQELLDEHDDAALTRSLPRPLAKHIECCDDCRELVRDYRKLFRGLSQLNVSEAAGRRGHRRGRIAAAAAVVIACGFALQNFRAEPPAKPQAAPTIVRTTHAPSQAPPVAVTPATPIQAASHPTVPDHELSTALAGMFDDQFTSRSSEMLYEVADGLLPVTTSMATAINVLLRVLPPAAEEPKESDRGARYDRYVRYARLA